MVSQLAVSLEEVNRKDVAQFVLEQFMSGKPRKKLFGWWKTHVQTIREQTYFPVLYFMIGF